MTGVPESFDMAAGWLTTALMVPSRRRIWITFDATPPNRASMDAGSSATAFAL